MDFSLFYFAESAAGSAAEPGTGARSGRYDLLLDGARFADEHGFTAVWTPERHFHPFGGIYPNPSVTGAAVAAVTSRVQIRAGSVVAPLHHPLRIAEEWSVVDNLSGGRAGVSFASGWHAVDFALRPENYADRRALVLETAQQVRRLWRGERIDVLDGTGAPARVGIHPRPVRPELPVWITSAGGVDTFRAAGSIGAGVLTHLLGQEPAELAGKIDAYRGAVAARPDADGWPGHVVLMVHTYLGADEDDVRAVVRDPMTTYLRSSLNLLLGSQAGAGRRIDPATLRDTDVDFLVRRSFDRYYDDGGLLGTVGKARRVVERLAALGVDEIACLIDFGLPAPQVLAALRPLALLRELCSTAGPVPAAAAPPSG